MSPSDKAEQVAAAMEEAGRTGRIVSQVASVFADDVRQIGRDYEAMAARVRSKLVEVTLCADPKDGNDPLEAPAYLRVMPRVGEMLEVGPGGHLDVASVSIPTGPDGRIEVWVEIDGYDFEELEGVMETLREEAADVG